jgi:hypothetical protein
MERPGFHREICLKHVLQAVINDYGSSRGRWLAGKVRQSPRNSRLSVTFFMKRFTCKTAGFPYENLTARDMIRKCLRNKILFLVLKLNSVAWVRDWTISTGRPPHVGEVSANFCGLRLSLGQRNGTLRPYSRLSRPKPLLFLPSSSSVVDAIPDPLLLRKSGSAGNRTRTSGSVARNSDH